VEEITAPGGDDLTPGKRSKSIWVDEWLTRSDRTQRSNGTGAMSKADVHLSWLFLAVAASVAWPHGGLAAAGHPCGSPHTRRRGGAGIRGKRLLLGEIHGTAEVPAFLGDLACRAAGSRMPLVVLLEVPSQEEPTFAHYLASDGNCEGSGDAPCDRAMAK